MKKYTYLKTNSVSVQLSPTNKSTNFKTTSAAKNFTTVTYANDKEVYPYELSFEVGSIISVNGHDLYGYKFRNGHTAPAFYIIVDEMNLLDDIGWDDTYVYFITSTQ